jgi:hypothetical protein
MYVSQKALDMYLTGIKMIMPDNVSEVYVAKSKVDCELVDKVKALLNVKKVKKFKKEYIKNNKNTSNILEEDSNALRHDFCLIISHIFDFAYKQEMVIST